MTQYKPSSLFPIVSTSVILAGVTVLFGVAAVGALIVFDSVKLIVPVLSTGGVCLSAALLALIPVRMMSGVSQIGAAHGFIVGLLVRMTICFGAIFVLIIATSLMLIPICISMVMWYLLMLCVEVFAISRYMRSCRAIAG